jgi:hypothetical protein
MSAADHLNGEQHRELVEGALHSWVGAPSDMELHMQQEISGVPYEGSANGARMRAQAAALLREIDTAGRPNDRDLFRGPRTQEAPDMPTSWSESRKVAEGFAKKRNKPIETVKKGQAKGIRMADYIDSGLNESERQWLIKPE